MKLAVADRRFQLMCRVPSGNTINCFSSEESLPGGQFTVPYCPDIAVYGSFLGAFGVALETLPVPFENKGFLACYSVRGSGNSGQKVIRVICPDPSDPSGRSVVLIKQEELEDFYKKQGFDPEKEMAERAERRRTQKAEIEKIRGKAIYAIDKQYPVQFPEGEWSADLKTFIIKDLNRLFGAAEVSYRGPVAKGPITQREILYRKYTPLYSREWLTQYYELDDVNDVKEQFAEFNEITYFGVSWDKIRKFIRIEYDDTELPIFCVTEEGMTFYEHAVEKYGEIHKTLQAFFDPDRCEPMQNLFYDGYENFLKDE
ncbi:MAG: hypothetical protein JXN62_02190, partial [Bacteroidales bacterium]|nr:hypothetical protein [Bacteroidales bacterium]